MLANTNETVPPTAVDSRLRCPSCDYNLTGIADGPSEPGREHRCPECGNTFDPEYVKAILVGAPQPIPIWDDRRRSFVVRFATICLLTWFVPTRVGRSFPRRYLLSSAKRFRNTAFVTAAIVVIAASLPETGSSLLQALPYVIGISLTCMLGVFLGISVCEFGVGAILDGARREDAPNEFAVLDSKTSASRVGLVGMFRSFTLLAALLYAGQCAGMLLMPWFFGRNDFPLAWIVPLWWWLALAAAIAVQPVSRFDKLASIAAIPAVVFIAGIVGFASGFLAMIILEGIADVFKLL